MLDVIPLIEGPLFLIGIFLSIFLFVAIGIPYFLRLPIARFGEARVQADGLDASASSPLEAVTALISSGIQAEGLALFAEEATRTVARLRFQREAHLFDVTLTAEAPVDDAAGWPVSVVFSMEGIDAEELERGRLSLINGSSVAWFGWRLHELITQRVPLASAITWRTGVGAAPVSWPGPVPRRTLKWVKLSPWR